MKTIKGILLVSAVLLVSGALAFAVVSQRRIPLDSTAVKKPYADSEVLVKFKTGVDLAEVRAFAKTKGLILKKHFKFLSQKMGQNMVLLKSRKRADAKNLEKNLENDSRVEYARPNYRRELAATPNDPRFSSLWGMHNTGQDGGTADADIDAPEAWENGTGSSNVVVAIIDSGIDYHHPDLAPNCWKNPGEIPGNGIDDDGNGYVDDIYGIDPAGADGSGNNPDVDPMDGIGHGSHCAGTIGARGNNSLGVVGVNWNVKIMALKFFGDEDGGGWDDDSIECMQYAVYQKAHGQNVVAINASWGSVGGSDSGPLRDAIEVVTDAGIVFCAAAGNGGDDGIGDDNDKKPGTRNHHYPSDYTLPGIISVAATDRNDALGGFSNYGATSVDLGAPGVAILSTVPGTYIPQSGDIFFDDMESGSSQWTTGGTNNTWAITTEQEGWANPSFPVPSPTHFWSDSPGVSGSNVNYVNDTDSWIMTSTDIDLSSYAGKSVYYAFSAAWGINTGDHALVQISNDGGSSWTTVHDQGYDGYIYYWSRYGGEIPEAFKTDRFRIRFRLTSDNDGSNYWGFLIDDVGIGTTVTYTYESWDGTSMATPHVTGAVAWLASQFPGETVAQRKERILEGGDDISALSGKTVTGKRLNLDGAYHHTPASASVAVTTPNGGEAWMMGTSYDITWTTAGTVGNVDIYYSLDGGGNWTAIVTGTANDGVYAWTVPSVTPSSECLIRVWESADHGVTDYSDRVFSIISDASGETVSEPDTPSGPASGMVGATYTYSTGGASSSEGHSIQYRFDWGDGTLSNWLTVGTTSALHTWMAPGTYNVRAMARCAAHQVQSEWSSPLPVSLADSPTWTGISRFDVCEEEGWPTLEWHTNTEIGVAGFNLWRQARDSKAFIKVNARLLPAIPGAPEGGVYRLVDAGADPSVPVVYRLEEIDSRGRATVYGPFVIDSSAVSWSGSTRPRLLRGREVPAGIDGYRRFRREPSTFEAERMAARSREKRPVTLQAARSPDRIRVTVHGKGLFVVSAGQVAAGLGISQSQAADLISRHNLRLTHRGDDIPWLGDLSGAGLYFYSPGTETVFTDQCVYFLERGHGLTMETRAAAAAGVGGENPPFMDSRHFEENHYPLLLAGMDPLGDLWFWDYVIGGRGAKDFAIHVPGVASGDARLTVTLQGTTDTPAALDHHAVVALNGSEIGDAAWGGANAHVLEAGFDASLLREGSNTISISGDLDTGAAYSTFYVDSFDLRYPRSYQAENNRLQCRAAGNPVITVSGLTDPQVVVLDVTAVDQPVELTGLTPDIMGRVSFQSHSSDREYLVYGLSAAIAPLSVTGDPRARIPGDVSSAEYIVIAPGEFSRTARELTDFRRSRGLHSLVVTLEAIYDQYNFGESNPFAIRDFLAEAYGTGRNHRLKYVVLAGKGTYDYKDCKGFGDNLVPALLAATPHGLCASDGIFGDVLHNDGLPEIAVGRLPAVTNAELQTMIDKIKVYEEGRGNWTARALFVADNNDEGGDFSGGSDRLDALAAGMQTKKVYHNGSAAETRNAITAAWNAGVALVNYCGHAGLRNLAQENFFDVSDANGLRNGDQLPLGVMLTCVAGRFEFPGLTSLGEALLLNPDGGMAGGLLPSGAAMHVDSMHLAELFYQAVYSNLEESAGKAMLAAMQTYLQQGGDAYLLRVFNWLGDPATAFK